MKKREIAALFAFFGGMFGLHHYYLGNKDKGQTLLILVFFGLGIIGLISGLSTCINLLSMSQKEFDKTYNGGKCSDVATLMNGESDSTINFWSDFFTAK